MPVPPNLFICLLTGGISLRVSPSAKAFAKMIGLWKEVVCATSTAFRCSTAIVFAITTGDKNFTFQKEIDYLEFWGFIKFLVHVFLPFLIKTCREGKTPCTYLNSVN